MTTSLNESYTTAQEFHGRPIGQIAFEAVQLAISPRWHEAVKGKEEVSFPRCLVHVIRNSLKFNNRVMLA